MTGECFFIDSSPIEVRHNKRINKHGTFEGLAEKGYHSMSWFYVFKIHIIINEKGDFVRFVSTKGNVSGIRGLNMAEGLNGLLVGDKGYICHYWAKYLEKYGLKSVTKSGKNMKSIKLSNVEKAFLGKRNIIETMFSQLKN